MVRRWRFLLVSLGVPCIPSGAFKQELHIAYIMGVKVFHWGIWRMRLLEQQGVTVQNAFGDEYP